MYCLKCGVENPDGAQSCTACGCDLVRVHTTAGNVERRVSRLAVVSLALAILHIVALSLALVIAKRPTMREVLKLREDFLTFFFIAVPISAVVLGLVSLVRIELSGGKLKGRIFAALGILISPMFFYVMVASTVLKTRSLAFRMTCGTHLSAIGRAMLMYANDYDGKLPRAGGPDSRWTGEIPDWRANERFEAYGLASDGTRGEVSVSSSFYLLVKYAEVDPSQVICKGDRRTSEFRLAKYGPGGEGLVDLWDFGPEPWKHCSYTYHMPYGLYALTTSSEPGMAVAADRNPWIDSPAGKAKDFSRFKPDMDPWNGTVKQGKYGSAITHQGDGQNVLFVDSHVAFYKRAFCGVQDDNIYTLWDGEDRVRGIPPDLGSQPQDRLDSLLVHDPPGAEAQ